MVETAPSSMDEVLVTLGYVELSSTAVVGLKREGVVEGRFGVGKVVEVVPVTHRTRGRDSVDARKDWMGPG